MTGAGLVQQGPDLPREGIRRLGLALEPDQMRVCQNQVFLLLPEHGAARLDLAVVQDMAAVCVVDGEVEAERGVGGGGRKGLIVVVLGAPQRAKDRAGSLAVASTGQLRSRSSGGDGQCIGDSVLVNGLLLAIPRDVGQAGQERGGPALPQQVHGLRFVFLGGDARECAEGAAEDASSLVLGHGGCRLSTLSAGRRRPSRGQRQYRRMRMALDRLEGRGARSDRSWCDRAVWLRNVEFGGQWGANYRCMGLRPEVRAGSQEQEQNVYVNMAIRKIASVERGAR